MQKQFRSVIMKIQADVVYNLEVMIRTFAEEINLMVC